MRKHRLTAHGFLDAWELVIGDPLISKMIIGHLLVEDLLVDLLNLINPVKKPPGTFNLKARACYNSNAYSSEFYEALKYFNQLRNRFAHDLGYTLAFDHIFKLAQKCGQASGYFSDDTIWQDRQKSEEWYGNEGCLTECIALIYGDLAWEIYERGGPDHVS